MTAIAALLLAGACGARTWLLDVASPARTVLLDDDGGASVELYVPAGCGGSPRCGAVVWLQPWDRGSLPRAWAAVLEGSGLVWIAPNGAGNAQPVATRVALALAAAEHARRALRVDPARLYVGGLSGGARVASAVALQRPVLFRGGLFAIGVDFFADAPSGHPRIAFWPAAFPPPDPARLALAKRRRFVLLTGERDFNRQEIHDLALAYRAYGFDASLVDVAGMGHELPSAACLRLALALLERSWPGAAGADAGACPATVTP